MSPVSTSRRFDLFVTKSKVHRLFGKLDSTQHRMFLLKVFCALVITDTIVTLLKIRFKMLNVLYVFLYTVKKRTIHKLGRFRKPRLSNFEPQKLFLQKFVGKNYSIKGVIALLCRNIFRFFRPKNL